MLYPQLSQFDTALFSHQFNSVQQYVQKSPHTQHIRIKLHTVEIARGRSIFLSVTLGTQYQVIRSYMRSNLCTSKITKYSFYLNPNKHVYHAPVLPVTHILFKRPIHLCVVVRIYFKFGKANVFNINFFLELCSIQCPFSKFVFMCVLVHIRIATIQNVAK